MNTITPRLFVAATGQNDGKTTMALGLFSALRERFGEIGFIKPVGQRFVEVEGKKIDEDTFLIDNTFHVEVPLEAMSPISVEPDFTRRYIDDANNSFLVGRIRNSFDRASWEKDFTIIEGTGHAGVGSVFDLSNARVASLLGAKVLLITTGGIGRPIDEIALNKALFDKEGVELAGVILNKVLPHKLDQVRDFAARGFQRLGIDLLGCIPTEPLLASATVDQVCSEIGGELLNAGERSRRKVNNVIIGAMNSGHALRFFDIGTLVITPGDREDIILAALSTNSIPDSKCHRIAALVLSGDLRPHSYILDLIKHSGLPVILSKNDSYTVASRIHSMTVKTLPGDEEKIAKIQSMIESYVDIDRVLEKLAG